MMISLETTLIIRYLPKLELSSSAGNLWLRSANADNGMNAGYVNDDGNVNNNDVYNDNNNGALPA